ncbi:desulfoferrodoxin FeS4 iron-binding domain-containing protein [bacterium]|nr:desulfoferrodoxin FeS4 iron-binding domain-containing protein [bacterium]
MTERLQFYKCKVCGNLVQVILSGEGELVCCGQPMTLVEAHKNDEEMNEKHVPVFSVTDKNGAEIQVGSVMHPSTNEHYIQFIETISHDKKSVNLQYFEPYDEPIMLLKDKIGVYNAKAFCNLHGLWEGEG